MVLISLNINPITTIDTLMISAMRIRLCL